MIISDLALNILASFIYDKAKAISKFNHSGNSLFTKQSISDSLLRHLTEVNNWSEELKHKGMDAKPTNHSYIGLKYFKNTRRDQHEDNIEPPQKINLKTHLEQTNKNTIILGQPGAGKTTSAKYIAQKIMFDENFCSGMFKFPVVIRFSELRRYKNTNIRESMSDWQGANINEVSNFNVREIQEGIFSKLIDIFGLFDIDELALKNKEVIERVLIDILEENRVFLILEGFDEYPFIDQTQLVEEIRKISIRTNFSKFLLTSRTVEFPYIIEHAEKFEIAPLDDNQILEFSRNWLEKKSSANLFFDQLKNSTYLDTARRPLTLSHLLTIFKKSNPPRIPNKPNAIYSKVVDLLIKEWDEERNVLRPHTRDSKYAMFQAERKKSFLCKLSFYLTKNYFGTTFSYHQLRVQYLELCESFELQKDDSELVMKELESHNGLFLKSSSNKYEFAHKSIQEYFTAEYLKGLPTISGKHIDLEKIPNELAILVAIASEPNEYFEELINIFINNSFSIDFVTTFLNRIYLENPDFESNINLAKITLKLFTFIEKINKSFEEEEKNYLQFQTLFLKNIAFKNSITLLEKEYSVIQETSSKIINACRYGRICDIKLNTTIKITNRLMDEYYLTKFSFIGEWIYNRAYYDLLLKAD